MYLIEEPLASYVYADAVERTYSHGLRRSVAVKPGCDFNYRLNVQAGDLAPPVEVEYRLPMRASL